jgi:hypothetical protein
MTLDEISTAILWTIGVLIIFVFIMGLVNLYNMETEIKIHHHYHHEYNLKYNNDSKRIWI